MSAMPTELYRLGRAMGIFAAIVLAATLAACTPLAAPSDVSCSVFRPIAYSASGDTPATIRDIRSHNAAYRAVCPAAKG